jgi:uncharacterized OB-fold protein
LTVPHRPLPEPTALSAEYWEAAKQRRFLIARCDDCGTAQFPREVACTTCLSTNVRWVEASGRGTLDTFTVIHREPFPDFPVPTVMAIVVLEEGPAIFTGIVGGDPAELACDLPVEVTFEDQDEAITLPMFQLRR